MIFVIVLEKKDLAQRHETWTYCSVMWSWSNVFRTLRCAQQARRHTTLMGPSTFSSEQKQRCRFGFVNLESSPPLALASNSLRDRLELSRQWHGACDFVTQCGRTFHPSVYQIGHIQTAHCAVACAREHNVGTSNSFVQSANTGSHALAQIQSLMVQSEWRSLCKTFGS